MPTFGLANIGATSGALGRRYANQSPRGVSMQQGKKPRAPYAGARGYLPPPYAGVRGYLPLGMGHSVQARSYAPPQPLGMGHSTMQRSAPGSGLMSVPSRPMGMTQVGPSGGGMLEQGRPRVFPGSGMVYAYPNEYAPGPMQRQQDDAQIARIQDYQRAGPGPYGGTAGMRHFGPLASQPAPALNMPQPGTIYGGGSQIHNVDGRTVGLGPRMTPGTYFGSEQAMQGARGAAGVYRDTNIGEPNVANMASAARAADHRAGLAEGRRNRAIGKYGLSHLQPTQNYTYDSNIGVGGGYTRTGPMDAGAGSSGPLANIADRQAALASIPSSPFAQATGFDASTAGFDDTIDTFTADSGNWSASDKQQFVADIRTRMKADPEYRKQVEAWLNQTEHVVTDSDVGSNYDENELVKINKMRALFGKPALKVRREFMPPEQYIPGW